MQKDWRATLKVGDAYNPLRIFILQAQAQSALNLKVRVILLGVVEVGGNATTVFSQQRGVHLQQLERTCYVFVGNLRWPSQIVTSIYVGKEILNSI